MYDSGITAASLIAIVKAEADISVVVTDASYYRWLNEVEQMLYTEIIKELKVATISTPSSPVAMTEIAPAASESQAIVEDVIKIYADGNELSKASVISSVSLSGYARLWYKSGNTIGYSLPGSATADALTVIYYIRPKIKTGAENINLPVEFIELVACRLRGEAYKLANDDGMAAKWLNDYNGYVEQFKAWMKAKNIIYGE